MKSLKILSKMYSNDYITSTSCSAGDLHVRMNLQSRISCLLRVDRITGAPPSRKHVPPFSLLLRPSFSHIIRDLLEIHVGCSSSHMVIEFFKQFAIEEISLLSSENLFKLSLFKD